MFAAPPPPRDLKVYLFAAASGIREMKEVLFAAQPDVRKDAKYALMSQTFGKGVNGDDASFLTEEVNLNAYAFGTAIVVSAGYGLEDDAGRFMFEALAAMTDWRPENSVSGWFSPVWEEDFKSDPSFPAHRWGPTVPPNSRGPVIHKLAAALATFYSEILKACFEERSQCNSHIQQMYDRLNQDLMSHGMRRPLVAP